MGLCNLVAAGRAGNNANVLHNFEAREGSKIQQREMILQRMMYHLRRRTRSLQRTCSRPTRAYQMLKEGCTLKDCNAGTSNRIDLCCRWLSSACLHSGGCCCHEPSVPTVCWTLNFDHLNIFNPVSQSDDSETLRPAPA